jgi:hypothetical protein
MIGLTHWGTNDETWDIVSKLNVVVIHYVGYLHLMEEGNIADVPKAGLGCVSVYVGLYVGLVKQTHGGKKWELVPGPG